MTEKSWDDNERIRLGVNGTQRVWDTDDGRSPDGCRVVQVGDQLFHGRYKVLEIHGGGMGVVYKCEDLVTHFTVALKTVQTAGGMTEDDVKNMVRSFKLIFRLGHPHIIRVNHLDRDDTSGNWFVVMDWVDGEDLETRLRKTARGVLSREETVRIMLQVADALDYAHDKGVVHRDVKCANIMMKPDGGALLIDFGIAGRAAVPARTVAPGGTDGLTVTVNPYTGTQGYQPPEQWRGEKTCAASDQYSLAVTAYRCLSGHLPFEHHNMGELREMVMYDDPPRIRPISDTANAVLRKAMAKKTGERYETCMAFVNELAMGLDALSMVVNAKSQSRRVAEGVHSKTLPHGDVTVDLNGVPLTLKYIPAGTFMMGSPESEAGRCGDERQHKVILTKDFWLGQYEVTQIQYEAVMGTNPSRFKNGGDYPVEEVSWDDALAFCKKVTEQERKVGRLPEDFEYTLPTEAQWEYACRAGTTTPFSFGSMLNGDKANCDGNRPYGTGKGKYWGHTIPVGSYEPNTWGLYDMHGNVREWCRDSCDYDENDRYYITDTYKDGVVDPWCRNGSERVIRGGGWNWRAACCRSAFRYSFSMSLHNFDLGFRVALTPVQ